MNDASGIDGYEISGDPARLDVDAIHAYLVRSYWSPGIPPDTVARAVRNSLCFGAYERVFALWHAIHLPLCVLLFTATAVHVIAVHMY